MFVRKNNVCVKRYFFSSWRTNEKKRKKNICFSIFYFAVSYIRFVYKFFETCQTFHSLFVRCFECIRLYLHLWHAVSVHGW